MHCDGKSLKTVVIWQKRGYAELRRKVCFKCKYWIWMDYLYVRGKLPYINKSTHALVWKSWKTAMVWQKRAYADLRKKCLFQVQTVNELSMHERKTALHQKDTRRFTIRWDGSVTFECSVCRGTGINQTSCKQIRWFNTNSTGQVVSLGLGSQEGKGLVEGKLPFAPSQELVIEQSFPLRCSYTSHYFPP